MPNEQDERDVLPEVTSGPPCDREVIAPRVTRSPRWNVAQYDEIRNDALAYDAEMRRQNHEAFEVSEAEREAQIRREDNERELKILAESMARGQRPDYFRLGVALLGIAPVGSRLPTAQERAQERAKERAAS